MILVEISAHVNLLFIVADVPGARAFARPLPPILENNTGPSAGCRKHDTAQSVMSFRGSDVAD